MHLEYHGSRLDPIEQQFYLKVVQAIRQRKTTVRADDITSVDVIQKVIIAVQYDYQEFIYVNFMNFPLWICHELNYIDMTIEYIYNRPQTEKVMLKMNREINQILSQIEKRGLSSAYQKVWFIHGWFIQHYTYDYSALPDPNLRPKAYNIEGVFIDKTAVCQGLAFAVRYLCRMLGIDCIVAKGMSFRPGNTVYESHAWNIIRAGDKAAHVDVTWDLTMKTPQIPIRYDYFFLSDMDMMRDHQYVGFPACQSLRISYHDKNHTVFTDIKELDPYISYTLKQGSADGKYRLQFKMKNRKETVDEIAQYVVNRASEIVRKTVTCNLQMNESQSVFAMELLILR